MEVFLSSVPIYFRFFIDDYLRDAEELSIMRHGAYLKLMLWYYARAKPIPNDLQRIYCRVGARSSEEEAATRYILEEFFRLQDNVWTHKRIEEELAHWRARSEDAKRSVLEREKKRNKINETTPSNDERTVIERSSNQNQNQNHIKPKIKTLAQNEFARFWKAYPKKKSKGQAEKAFSKIKPDLIDTVLKALSKARESPDWLKEGGTYIPYPATWLNARGWEDEFEVEIGPQAVPCTECPNPSTTWWLGKRYCEQHYMQAKRGESCKN